MSIIWQEHDDESTTPTWSKSMVKRKFSKLPTKAFDLEKMKKLNNANAPVTRPVGYTQGKIECWNYIIDQNFGFFDGTVVKYIARARYKGNRIQDLKKAREYLNKLIATLESGKSVS